ncbi:MAG: hypothetical protein GY928_26385 [Colwellia sp.]|nr:hypothetical protein [Colwellia sp.]
MEIEEIEKNRKICQKMKKKVQKTRKYLKFDRKFSENLKIQKNHQKY